jgi:hypothetical protein
VNHHKTIKVETTVRFPVEEVVRLVRIAFLNDPERLAAYLSPSLPKISRRPSAVVKQVVKHRTRSDTEQIKLLRKKGKSIVGIEHKLPDTISSHTNPEVVQEAKNWLKTNLTKPTPTAEILKRAKGKFNYRHLLEGIHQGRFYSYRVGGLGKKGWQIWSPSPRPTGIKPIPVIAVRGSKSIAQKAAKTNGEKTWKRGKALTVPLVERIKFLHKEHNWPSKSIAKFLHIKPSRIGYITRGQYKVNENGTVTLDFTKKPKEATSATK